MAFDFEISGFRSFKEPTRIKLEEGSRFLFVVGQNNVGKSNVLAAVSLACNREINQQISDELTKNTIKISYNGDFVEDKRLNISNELKQKMNVCVQCIQSSNFGEYAVVSVEVDSTYDKLRTRLNDREMQQLYDLYFYGNSFQPEFLKKIIPNFNYKIPKMGTVFVPTLRHLAKDRHEIPSFLSRYMYGNIQSPSSFINILSNLDRSEQNPDEARAKLNKIHKFMSYCLECDNVEVQVANTKNKIHLKIDYGSAQDLSVLGSGVE